MKIIITEEQFKKLLESKNYYDFWDISYVFDTIQEFLQDNSQGITKKRWKLIPFEQYRNALIEFVRYGEFMRFPTKYIDQWADIVTNNTLTIQACTELAGHTQYFPFEEFCDAFGFDNESEEYEKYYGNFDACSEYLDEVGFYDWAILPDGTDAISDYGMEPLYKLIQELEETSTPEQKIVVINKIMDVWHMRGDLSSAFIQGGSKALSQISYPEENLTENTLQDINEMPYPESFNMDTFKSIRSFNGRVNYCRQHLTRIAEGSSRMVFKIDDEKVLKLAKNKKGLLQNKTEIDKGYNEGYFDCIAHVFDFDEQNYFYVEMELARKCTLSDFKRITGYDFSTFSKFLISSENYTIKNNFSQEFIDKIYDEGSILVQVDEFIRSWNEPIGDLIRINNYGIVSRNGEEYIVIVDYGLTQDILLKYY